MSKRTTLYNLLVKTRHFVRTNNKALLQQDITTLTTIPEGSRSMGTSHNSKQRHTITGTILCTLLSLFTANAMAASTLVKTTTTTNVYDSYGNPTSITISVTDGTDTYTTVTSNSYDEDTTTIDNWHLGRLVCASVTETIPGASSETRISGFEYDGNGLLTKEVIEPASSDIAEPNGVADCVTGSIDSDITLTTTYSYDAFGNKETVTVGDGPGGVEDRSTTTTWGEWTAFATAHDANGRYPITVENAFTHKEYRDYDNTHGGMVELKGPNGLTTTWEYDSFGRQTKEIRADGTETTITRAWCDGFLGETGNGNCPTDGALALTTQSDGEPTSTTYSDALGRVIQNETDAFDSNKVILVDTVYNAKGQVEQKSRPYFFDSVSGADPIYWHEIDYDDVGRVIKEVNPDGSENRVEYNGLATTRGHYLNDTATVPLSEATQTNNARGELAKTEDALGTITRYAYDPFGNLEDVIVDDVAGGEQVTTSNTYDIRGRKVDMTDPDMGYWEYEYNVFGELTKQTDAKLQIVEMEYDKLGRLETRDEAEGNSTWTYDTATTGVGKLASVVGAEGKNESYNYDTLGRLVSTTTTIIDGGNTTNYVTSQTYDADGRLDTITYPSGFEVVHAYNTQGYLARVCDASQNTFCDDGVGLQYYWKADTQNAEGQLTKQLFGNGVDTEKTFKPENGVVEKIMTGTTGNNAIQDLEFKFDTQGNLTDRYDCRQNLSEVFAYDELNRMDSSSLGTVDVDCDVNGTPTVKDYAYDVLGNITEKDDIGNSDHTGYYHYDIGTQPHAVDKVVVNGVDRLFTYDANGNMTDGWNFTSDVARKIYYTSYNKPNEIKQGTDLNNPTVTLKFKYGANREQFKQEVLGTNASTRYYINGYYEEDLTNGVTTDIHYIKAGGSTIALYKQKSDSSPDETRYLHRDHLGSITEITKEDATVAESLSYDPHGKRRETTWADATAQIEAQELKRCFTGHQYLDDVGLIHMGGRVYDPDLGRFLSPDPFVQFPENSQSFNRYSYVLNNPLSYTDPSGFFIGGLFDFVADIFEAAVDFFVDIVEFVIESPIAQLAVRAVVCNANAACHAALAAAFTAANGGGLGDVLFSAATAYAATSGDAQIIEGIDNDTLADTLNIGKTLFGSGSNGKSGSAESTAKQVTKQTTGNPSTSYGGAKFANGAAYSGFGNLHRVVENLREGPTIGASILNFFVSSAHAGEERISGTNDSLLDNPIVREIIDRVGLQLSFDAGIGPGARGTIRTDSKTLDDGTLAVTSSTGKVVGINAQAQLTVDIIKTGEISGVVTNTGGCLVTICVNSLIDIQGNIIVRIGVGPIVPAPSIGFSVGPTVRRDPFSFLKE